MSSIHYSIMNQVKTPPMKKAVDLSVDPLRYFSDVCRGCPILHSDPDCPIRQFGACETEPLKNLWYSYTRRYKIELPKKVIRHDASFSELAVRKIMLRSKQDVSALCYGPKGTGKSYTVQTIAFDAAKKLAKRRDGNDEWMNYYSIKNCAVMRDEAFRAQIENAKPHQIYIYDDVGADGWNARDFQGKANKAKNAIFQINRIDSTIQIFTTITPDLIDITPRKNVTHYLEGINIGMLKDAGYNALKISMVKPIWKQGKTYYPFPLHKDGKIIMNLALIPPPCLAVAYDTLRTDAVAAVKLKKMDEAYGAKDEPGIGISFDDEKKAPGGMTDRRKNKVEAFGEEVTRLRQVVGLDKKEAYRNAMHKSNLTPATIQLWKREGLLTPYGYPPSFQAK